MKALILYFFSFLGCVLITACSSPPPSVPLPESSTSRFVSSSTPTNQESFKVKAKFIDFEIGDVDHYLFEDEQGEIWDFSDCADKDFIFKQNLAPEKHNDFNKGWTSNKILQGRWFLLECGTRQQPLYPDGPSDIAQVIKQATLLY